MNEELNIKNFRDEINREGFEGDNAVLFGKKEDMPRLLNQLEQEGKADDLETYIRMHKEIRLPKNEISNKLLDAVETKKRLVWFINATCGGGEEYSGMPNSIIYYFIDKDANIASFDIDPQKLTPTRKIIEEKKTDPFRRDQLYYEKLYKFISEQFEELGFIEMGANKDENCFVDDINEAIANYQKKLEAKFRQKQKENFDF